MINHPAFVRLSRGRSWKASVGVVSFEAAPFFFGRADTVYVSSDFSPSLPQNLARKKSSSAITIGDKESAMSFVMEPGVKIRGRYEIEKALGKGGLGHSYLAKDLYRSESVVIKVIGIGTESRWTALRPWDDALSRLRRLSHSGVPSILDQFSFDEDGEGFVALVQEYVTGKSLEDLIQEKGPMSTEDCRDMTQGLLETLDYLHGQKVPHGAVRPATVFFEDPEHLGKSELAGFVLLNHIAHRLGQKDAYGSARAYIRPHMFQEETIDLQGDSFSLAFTVFFALTGKHPPVNSDELENFFPEEHLGNDNPWVPFMEECFQGRGEGHFHRLRDLVPTTGPEVSGGGGSSYNSSYESSYPDKSYGSSDNKQQGEVKTYTGEVVDGPQENTFTSYSSENTFTMDGVVIAENGHITYDGRKKLDSLPADIREQIEAQIQEQRRQGMNFSTGIPMDDGSAQKTMHSEKVEINGKVVMQDGVVTPEAQAELDKLPSFLRDKVMSAIKEKQSSGSRGPAESFDKIKDRISQEVGMTSTAGGYTFSIPKSWTNYLVGIFTLGIGGVFSTFFIPLFLEGIGELGPFGLVFVMFAVFPLMGLISLFGKSTVELYPDKIIRRFSIFGIQTLNREIPLGQIHDVFINRVRGSKGGVTHYLCIRYQGGKVNIGSGLGGVDKHRQDIVDMVRAWWLENKR
jgi:serine/threonine protein kinase